MTGGMNVITSLRRPAATAATLALLACAIAGVSSCGSGGAAAGFDAATVKKLRLAVEKVVSRTGAPGAVAGVWTPGGSWSYATGIADSATGRKMVTSDMVAIGGSTMTFVATVVLQLVEEKRLRLDEPLSKYNTQVPAAQSITIRQLLNHTSGIPSYTAMNEFDKYVKPEPLKKWTNDELYKMVENATPDFEPGAGFKYSNSNYLLAGLIIEKVSGNSYSDELKMKICAPLGLKDTYYAVTPEIEGPHFHGYEDSVDVSLFDPSGPGFAGAIVSTLADLKIWSEAFGEGRLISKQLREESAKFIVEDGYPQTGYGLGMMAWGSFHGHSGMIKGGCVVMFRDPDARITIICMYPMTADYLKLATEYTFNETADLLIPGSYMKSVKAYSVIKK